MHGDINRPVITGKCDSAFLLFFAEICSLADFCRAICSLRELDLIAEVVPCSLVFLNEKKKAST